MLKKICKYKTTTKTHCPNKISEEQWECIRCNTIRTVFKWKNCIVGNIFLCIPLLMLALPENVSDLLKTFCLARHVRGDESTIV